MQSETRSIKPTPLAGLDPLSLAGALAARICHDLAGALGALTGTLEVAVEENDREALGLATALAQDASARLALLRAAWGTDSELPDLAIFLPGLPGAERLALETSGFIASDEAVRRLALSLLLVAAAGLPKGGLISLGGDDMGFWVAIEGARASWPKFLEPCLTDSEALIESCETPSAVAIALACLHARARGLAIHIHTPTRLSVG